MPISDKGERSIQQTPHDGVVEVPSQLHTLRRTNIARSVKIPAVQSGRARRMILYELEHDGLRRAGDPLPHSTALDVRQHLMRAIAAEPEVVGSNIGSFRHKIRR